MFTDLLLRVVSLSLVSHRMKQEMKIAPDSLVERFQQAAPSFFFSSTHQEGGLALGERKLLIFAERKISETKNNRESKEIVNWCDFFHKLLVPTSTMQRHSKKHKLRNQNKDEKDNKKTKLGKFNSGVKNHCCATSASKQATKLLADFQLTGDKQTFRIRLCFRIFQISLRIILSI